MLFVSGLHLFWMPSPPELTVSSPFHVCYSFVRIYQSLAIPFLTEIRFIVLTHAFEKLVFNVEMVDHRGYLEC